MNLRNKINRLKQLSLWLFWRGKHYLLSIIAVMVTALYLTKLLTFYPNTIVVVLSLTGPLIILTQQMLNARQFAYHKPNTFLTWLKSYPRTENIIVAVSYCRTCGGWYESSCFRFNRKRCASRKKSRIPS